MKPPSPEIIEAITVSTAETIRECLKKGDNEIRISISEQEEHPDGETLNVEVIAENTLVKDWSIQTQLDPVLNAPPPADQIRVIGRICDKIFRRELFANKGEVLIHVVNEHDGAEHPKYHVIANADGHTVAEHTLMKHAGTDFPGKETHADALDTIANTARLVIREQLDQAPLEHINLTVTIDPPNIAIHSHARLATGKG